MYGKDLKCLQQYYTLVYVPWLVEHQQEIARRVKEYYEKDVRQLIPLEDYCIDFALLTDGSVIVIEINPPVCTEFSFY